MPIRHPGVNAGRSVDASRFVEESLGVHGGGEKVSNRLAADGQGAMDRIGQAENPVARRQPLYGGIVFADGFTGDCGAFGEKVNQAVGWHSHGFAGGTS